MTAQGRVDRALIARRQVEEVQQIARRARAAGFWMMRYAAELESIGEAALSRRAYRYGREVLGWALSVDEWMWLGPELAEDLEEEIGVQTAALHQALA